MKIFDLNVLLYAVNADSAYHAAALETWTEALADGDEPVGLPWVVILGFLRITTSPRVFPSPLDTEQAIDHVDRWLAHPNVRTVPESGEHWRILRGLLTESGAAGNLTSDAHLAALSISNGATLVSFDSDFARFARLRWIRPATRR